MPALLRARPDPVLFDLLEESGRTVQRSTLLLRDLLDDYPEHAHLARDLFLCEQDGDRITHDLIHHLSQRRARRPFDSQDGHQLATALDDIVDLAAEAGDTLATYHVEAPMDQAVRMARVLHEAVRNISEAIPRLRTLKDIQHYTVEVNRLENEGDRVVRQALASLFERGIDPMLVIRWKDIFERLEDGIDATERVANILEGIVIKNS